MTDGPLDRGYVDRGYVDGLGVTSEVIGAATVLHVTGELDLVSAPRLRTALSSLHGGTSGEVVIDLAELVYIDSVGIGLLVASRRGLDADGRTLTIRNPAPQVLRLFEITGLVEYLGLTETTG